MTSREQGNEAVAPISRPSLTDGSLFIGGARRDAVSQRRRDVIDPSTGKKITTVAEGDAQDVDAAVRAARAAFDEGPWRHTPARERGRVLTRAAQLIRERTDELVALESIDAGKPVSLTRIIDVGNTIAQFEYYGGLAHSLAGATRQTAFPSMAYTVPEPIGVIGAITPFNFPLILSTVKIAAALAAGNTMVHKPAEDTPLTALVIAEILAEAGLPDGVLNVVTGGGEAGDALVRHPGVDKIAFTGSTAVGRAIASTAGESVKPVTLELGGKSAQIIFEDADLDVAIGKAIEGFVFNTGQFCMGGTRLLVARPLFDTVSKAVAGAAGGVPLGDPFDPATVIGPIAGARHLEKVERYVELARSEPGAEILAGGHRIDLNGGYFYAPTVIVGMANDSRLVQEEVFGPVLTIQPFDTEDEAVALANSTQYGLAAGLHTRDLNRAHRVASRLQAGIVWVNTWGMLDPAMPFGGLKQSGYGREYGPEGLAEYLNTKSVIIATA
ncbi:aldehyde dehydrogenase family protein [Micromonospora sp. NPDC049679]|uniref:aldehyde dehydrogenase family protein n=1 Tax=Micromonospora sp. NPDC049679 TaxID=3155920 RepID=UPI003409BBE8